MDIYQRKIPGSLLLLVCAVIWIWCIAFQIYAKTSFLDDTFIYLHIAGNIVEQGSARFFPVAESPALLASSPLRLVILVPSTILSRLFVDPDRSIAAARLTLVVSGLLSSLIFIPFFWGRSKTWLAGLALAGVVGLSTESGLQMEGLLVFWLAFTVLTSPRVSPPGASFFLRLGILVGLTIVTRPEYGAAAFLLAAVYACVHRNPKTAARFIVALLAIGGVWVVASAVLGVYPIPTTYLAKVLAAEQGMFRDGTFWDSLPRNFRTAFVGGSDVPVWLMGVVVAAVVVAVSWSDRRFWWALSFLAIVFALELRAPGNYLWYHENLFIAFATLCGAALVLNLKRVPRAIPSVLAALAAVPLLAFTASGLGRNRPMSWNFEQSPSRVSAYRKVADCSTGRGTFLFPQVEECHVVMNEIGIVAYFGGAQMWLLDASGLAQPGSLGGAAGHRLERFYPRRVLRSFDDELSVVAARFDREDQSTPVYFASAMTSGTRADLFCDYFFPRPGLCLEKLERPHHHP